MMAQQKESRWSRKIARPNYYINRYEKIWYLFSGYKINKCEQYWPNAIDKPKIFEHMEITLLEQSEHVTNKLMERKLKVRGK